VKLATRFSYMFLYAMLPNNQYLAKVEHIIPISAQRAHPPWVGPLIVGSDGDSSLIHRTNRHIPIDTPTVILGYTGIGVDK
jgi:hypothetical protein